MPIRFKFDKALSDRIAFKKIRTRLEDDVGSLIDLIKLGKTQGYFKDTAPFWPLARMLFPIAESLGRLLLRHQSASANLKYGLEQLGKDYQGKSALISLIYRHSLMHQDVLRILKKDRTTVAWNLKFNDPLEHLKIKRFRKGLYEIKFDLTKFYEDILIKLKELGKKHFKREVQKEYNSWSVIKLKGKSNLEKAAIQELSNIRKLNL